MVIADLRTELAARGFDYLDTAGSNTRKDYFLNRGYYKILEREAWPFLRATTTGTAPLTIADLGQVLFVTDSTTDQELQGIDERTIRNADPDLASTGQPAHWFLTGTTTLNVWPANTTNTITVVYQQVPDALSDANTTPVIPSRYHYLIVDAAVVLAYKDNDEPDSSLAAKADLDEELADMANALLHRNYQNAEDIVSGTWYDG